MATSSMAVDTETIVTLADDDQNAVANLNTNFDEIVTKFNAMLETSTGHSHDDVDSPSISIGIGNLTAVQYSDAVFMGGLL